MKKARRVKTKKDWKDKLWPLFSEYIRRKYADWRGNVHCFTCKKIMHWKQVDAGHFLHRHEATYFDERNVRPQCFSCNRMKHGNSGIFAINLLAEYTPKELRRLEKDYYSGRTLKISEIKKMIEVYQNKLKKL